VVDKVQLEVVLVEAGGIEAEHTHLLEEEADAAVRGEVAAALGVSDSLVSDYRRRIEQELRALSFGEVEEARRFESALRERVRELILASEQEKMAV